MAYRRVQKGDVKKAKDMTEREKRSQRKRWRTYKAEQKRKRSMVESLLNMSPPATPSMSGPSRQRLHGEAIRRINKRAMTKRIKDLEEQLVRTKLQSEKYRKRWERSRPLTPRKKTMKLLRDSFGSAKSKLLFHVALVEQIRHKYRKAKTERMRNIYARMIAGKLLQKYKISKFVQTEIGIGTKRLTSATHKPLQMMIQRQYFSKRYRLKKLIIDFFCRDDVSRMLSGKKETVKKGKTKKQKRVLMESLIALYSRFCTEFPSDAISYPLFCKMRPFWV